MSMWRCNDELRVRAEEIYRTARSDVKHYIANIRGLVTRKKLAPAQAEKALSMVKGTLDYSQFKDVDMVIEAVIENVPLKQKIFSEIENVCPPHCILATNTSTIDLNLMPLLEIVRTEKTSAQVILDVMTVGKIINKSPVVVGNCTGFAVNPTQSVRRSLLQKHGSW